MKPSLFLLVIFVALLSVQQQFVNSLGSKGHLHTLRDYYEKKVHVADLTSLKKTWANNLVPYRFADDVPDSLRELFLNATAHISKNSCIQYKGITSATEAKEYPAVLQVIMSDTPGLCAAEGGFAVKTKLKLSTDCGVIGVTIPGVIVHELLHILGFKHTQMRTDRDKHIQLNLDEVPEDRQSQFSKGDKNMVDDGRWPYDPMSILHYSQHADAKDKSKSTIESKDGTQFNEVMGQRRHLSPFDILELNDAYCDGNIPLTADNYNFLEKLLKEKEAKTTKEPKRDSSLESSFSSDKYMADSDEEEEVKETRRKRRLVQKLKRVIRALRLLL